MQKYFVCEGPFHKNLMTRKLMSTSTIVCDISTVQLSQGYFVWDFNVYMLFL